jgi:hypothetical protein
MRVCTACGARKPVSDFYPNRRSVRPECKKCTCARQQGKAANVPRCPDCGERVRKRGRCGFCVEIADGISVSATTAPLTVPVTAEANRKRVAVAWGG